MINDIMSFIKKDPNISPKFTNNFCFCGGNMLFEYNEKTREIILTCNKCGKQKKFLDY